MGSNGQGGCENTHPTNGDESIDDLIAELCSIIVSWCPEGSDPGLCVASQECPREVIDFGHACQTQLMRQSQARSLAEEHGIFLRGLGGTEDGVIGALAAIGLINTHDDGRVIYAGDSEIDYFDVSGVQSLAQLSALGVDEVRRLDDGQRVPAGRIDVGKRLRPNYRQGQIVLFVSPCEQDDADWRAERVV